jgi:hypothetical protein
MNPNFLLAVLTWIVIVALVCGAVLLFPISRRLAELLHLRIEEKRKGAALESRDLQHLQATLSAHEAEIARLVEKQEFLERLLEERGAFETTAGHTREGSHAGAE